MRISRGTAQPVSKSSAPQQTQFDAQVARDQLKQTICSTHGVALILVPHTVSRQGMEAYLREQLQRHGLLSVMAQASSEASGPLPVAGAL